MQNDRQKPVGSSSEGTAKLIADYCRNRDLPKLIGLWPTDTVTSNGLADARLVQQIATALRRERQRGRAGHFAYDLARHHQLLIAYQAELALLKDIQGSAGSAQATVIRAYAGAAISEAAIGLEG